MEIVVDPLVTSGIFEYTGGDVPDLEGTLYDIAHYMSEVPLDRITEFETTQRQLEAGIVMILGGDLGGWSHLLRGVWDFAISLVVPWIMTITRSGMTPKAIEELINQRVAEALATYEANRNLTVKNNDLAAYPQRFQELTMLCTKMVLEEDDQVEKFTRRSLDNIRKRNKVEHLTRDCKATISTTSTQRGQVVNHRVLTFSDVWKAGDTTSVDCPMLKDPNSPGLDSSTVRIARNCLSTARTFDIGLIRRVSSPWELCKKEHAEHLKLILELLKKEELYVKFSKCEFWLSKVQFLSHVIDSEGIHVDPTKIESIKDWASPKTLTEIR
ncbi:hypothetical protein Tco_0551515 [Tanacetum coccineum]